MKVPDIIYTDGGNTCAPAPIFSNYANVKYIRADIAELTWEDIEKIDELIREVGQRIEHIKKLIKKFSEGS